MRTITLGRTGIVTTAAGLGCGGFSRLGIEKYGEDHSAGIVKAAYESGVRFIDTATAYRTEAAVGKGLEGYPRDSYVLSTKFPLFHDNWQDNHKQVFADTIDASLRALKTDYIDIYNLHGVPSEEYSKIRDMLYPEMMKARDAGKIRFPGITERFVEDPSHKMLHAALEDDLFDVYMVGYNILNPSAAKTVFPETIKKNIGILCMFAVRYALTDPVLAKAEIQKILDHGQGGPGLEATEDALNFLIAQDTNGNPIASSIMDAAYRFCAHTEGIDVVLTGTGNEAHLKDNLASLESKQLPSPTMDKLEQLFGNSDCVSCQDA